ncbi:MAG: right-handed parallel beta-helix repeat-containing protein [Bacteriovorax sp.]|nr:right-handed parallel beta-helix repeat-containing protein [Rhizobacter sp.]
MFASLMLLVASLAGCGGGGADALISGPSADAGGATQPGPAPTPAPAPSTTPAPDPAASAPTSTTAVSTPIPAAHVLGASASLSLAGVPEQPPTAAVLPANGTGRGFYLNSATGDDGNDGRAAASGGSGSSSGPWRTLARLATSGLAAGDVVQLACGSVWHETLRLPASGTAAQPIVVSAPPAGCSTAPAIDGGVALAPSAWVQHRGNIYKASLDAAPLQLLAAGGVFTEAHHPNRGDVAADPTSPYLALATDGNAATLDGRTGSTLLATGADLLLPTGATLGAGTRVRVRTNPYIVDESAVASFDGRQLTLARATTYPVVAGWGYLLLGQLWMLDSAGEWYFDAATRQLYAWMPNSAAPTATVTVSTLATGIDLQAHDYIVIDGLAVRNVGLGVDLHGAKAAQLRNGLIQDVAGLGVNAAATTLAVIESNRIERSGNDAISGWGAAMGSDIGDATGMTVRNNLVRDSGVLMQGDQVLSLPRRSLAAIFIGANAVASGNTVINAGYIGILGGTHNVIEDNFIYGACSVQDDCGGIYTGGAGNNSQIRRNTVVHSRGALAGQPLAQRGTAAQGIYIDDDGEGITVEDNTVMDADNGILMHNGARNTVRGTRLYGNRASQIWLQEDANRHNPNGDMLGNVIEANQIAPVSPRALGYLLTTRFASTAAFGRFDQNRFFDRASANVAYSSSSASGRAFTFGQWRGSTGAGSTLPTDALGSGISLRGYTNYSVSGANLVANSGLLTDSAGWNTWNQTAPAGLLSRGACPAGVCLRYVAGGSAGVLSSPGFTLQKGRWYRLSVDISTETDQQWVPLVVRIGGADYASVSDRSLSLYANRAWGRYSVAFQATATVDPTAVGGAGLSARIDVDGIEAGKSISVAHLELVPITPDPLAQTSGAIANAGTQPLSAACPFAATQPALCGKLFNLADDQPISWPLTVPPRGAVIVYAQELSLRDSDGDGVPDAQDSCPGSTPGVAVDASGCEFVPH